jgi:hypothetical protein
MMKMRLIILVLGILLLPGIGNSQNKVVNAGDALSGKPLLSTQAAAAMYKNLSKNDTVTTGFKAKVREVCQMRGCWVRLELENNETVLVDFKDYGFFVPKDITGLEMWVEGKAYLNELSEGDHRHLARDAGASEKEIKAIKGKSVIPGFTASGVRIIR